MAEMDRAAAGRIVRRIAAGGVLAAALALPGVAAAQERPACTTVTSVPAKLERPGRYCLANNLSYAGTETAVVVSAPDVTLDLRGYAIVRVIATTAAPPPATALTRGIVVENVPRATILGGGVRGFSTGIQALGPLARVEGVDVEATTIGITTGGEQAIIRDNRVIVRATPATSTGMVSAILANGGGEVARNVVSVTGANSATCIQAGGAATIHANQIACGGNSSHGIRYYGNANAPAVGVITDNRIGLTGTATGTVGIVMLDAPAAYGGNIVMGAKSPYASGRAFGTNIP